MCLKKIWKHYKQTTDVVYKYKLSPKFCILPSKMYIFKFLCEQPHDSLESSHFFRLFIYNVGKQLLYCDAVKTKSKPIMNEKKKKIKKIISLRQSILIFTSKLFFFSNHFCFCLHFFNFRPGIS